MCGIAGVFSGSGARIDPESIIAMNNAIVHRGPDEEGTYCDDVVGLAMRRLSIIGLGNGRQPIFNEDRTVAVIMNGEIYNYRQLRSDLEQRGHRFSTLSDVEVAVHLYEEYGTDFVRSLRGMFAFALYDRSRERLILGRDRPGKKPLYYTQQEGCIWFASEIKALLASGRVPSEVDAEALVGYLANGFVVGSRTLFKGIRKVPAGHVLEVGRQSVSLRRYWDLPSPVSPHCTFDEAADRVRTLLGEAVRVRLMSEVPLGAFLSGGVDSSAVVAIMAQELRRPVETFAVGFNDSAFDELAYARTAAETFGTQHHELLVDDCDSSTLERINYFHDEPASDPAAVPTFALARFAREHVTVALTGEGGDELFAGYKRHHLQARLAQLDRIPGAHLVAAVLARGETFGGQHGARRLWKGAWAASMDPADRPRALLSVLTDAGVRRVLRRDLREGVGKGDCARAFRELQGRVTRLDPISQVLYVDSHSQLPDQLLMKVDKMTMAASLEARCPFLDQQLVEYVATLPASFKRIGGESKRILRRAVRGLVPDSLLDRPKHGFEVPVRRWMLGGLAPFVKDLLLTDRAAIHDYLEAESVRAMWRRLLVKNDTQLARQMWMLLNLAVWHYHQQSGGCSTRSPCAVDASTLP